MKRELSGDVVQALLEQTAAVVQELHEQVETSRRLQAQARQLRQEWQKSADHGSCTAHHKAPASAPRRGRWPVPSARLWGRGMSSNDPTNS
jgi:hypothetical protein